MTYSYFPGCSLHGMAKEFDLSARSLCDRLGLKLEEAPNWICCGATPAHSTSHLLSIALPAHSLSEVWKAKKDLPETPTLVAACASCYSRLRIANHELRTDADLRAQVQQAVETDYAGQVEVRHLLDVLRHDLGPDAIKQQVMRPLSGLKIACYYGCLLLRPPKIVAIDDPDNPQIMEDLLTAAGAECLDWPYKTECCGGGFSLSRPDLVCKLVHDILREAQEAGADALAVACPLCQSNLDMRQSQAAKQFHANYQLPVFYFTQLLGLAVGLPTKLLGLERLLTSPQAALQKLAAGQKEGS